MPYKPKITTRGISTSTVSADNIPKGAALTNNELDSNFLNIRDASIGIKGTDSTIFDIQSGDTITFNNANITTDSTGTFVTLSSEPVGLGDLEVVSYASSGYDTLLRPTGGPLGDSQQDLVLSGINLGKVSVPGKLTFGSFDESNNRITVEGDSKAIVSGGSNDISADDKLIIQSGSSQSSDRSRIWAKAKYLQLNHNLNTFIQATGGGGDFYIQNGVSQSDPTTGAHNSIILTDDNDGEIIITPKAGKWVDLDGAIKIQDNVISATRSNDDLVLSSSGTGTIQMRGKLDLNDNVITNSSGTLQVEFEKNISLTKSVSSSITVNSSGKFLTVGVSGGASIGIGYNPTTNSNSNDTSIHCYGLGRLNLYQDGTTGLTSTTIGANGAASALTANPVGYVKIKVNGTEYQVPYYNV
jgi:hypothetical protein